MSRERDLHDKQAYKIFIGLGVVILTVVGFKILTAKEKVNKLTNCPADITRESVFILDRSSPVAEQTKIEIKARIANAIHNKVQAGERISFYEVNDNSYTELKSLAFNEAGEFCKPRTEVNKFTENEELTRKRYEAKIRALLDNKHLETRGVQSKSPIAQVVFDVSLSEHMSKKSVSFYLFSDLMENSKDLTLYGCTNGKQAVQVFKINRSGRAERPAFRNIANFEVHRVPTKHSPDVISCRNYFWNWFLGDIKLLEETTKATETAELFKDLPG